MGYCITENKKNNACVIAPKRTSKTLKQSAYLELHARGVNLSFILEQFRRRPTDQFETSNTQAFQAKLLAYARQGPAKAPQV